MALKSIHDYYQRFSFKIFRRQTIQHHMRQQCYWAAVHRAIVAQNDLMDIRRAHLVHIRIRIKRSTVNRKDNTVSHNIRQVRICHTRQNQSIYCVFSFRSQLE